MDPVNVLAELEIRSFTRSWHNRGYLKTVESTWIRPCFLLRKNFNVLFVRMGPAHVGAKPEVPSFTSSAVPETKAGM